MSRLTLTSLLLILLLISVGSLFIGASTLSGQQIIDTLLHSGEYDFIVNQYRLPRLLLAIGVGAGLGLSGSLIQGVIRNPLASPDLMGISAGAGLAATALLVFYAAAPVYLLLLTALSGGLIAAAIILLIAYKTKPTPIRLALIGIAISTFLSSGIDFLIIVNPVEMNTAMVWLTGSLWGRNWTQVPIIWATLAIVLPFAFWLAWRLDVMGLGEDCATSLGIRPSRLQLIALLTAVILASISVAVAGTIAFIGLLAPHLARMLFGHDHKYLIPASALLGALMLIIADTLARGLQPPLELPAGVLTSLIGAPYFIFLLQRYKAW
ncbi:iron ABC transporter permease [Psychromonas sp. 14N.309.X.WAT.B.A12]|uniref:FecCD family ABC transporter permease n=1 Tax=unclassified Psychromonas TaxID=2614957 RepID=UPI0025B05509|nr:iron chelate uptake ABC transporter family permease subunit [Psychromonas sp. 14N.309.X.WAT.B.A12]MDN2662716.1 iron chelate uptake ABC transporter family permease subunit [Psychromonas sp. 14N.309.X.WAT.B.A12]